MKASLFVCAAVVAALALPAPGQGTFAVGTDESIAEAPRGVFFVNTVNGEVSMLFSVPGAVVFYGATDAGDEHGFWGIAPYGSPSGDRARLYWIDVFAKTCAQVGPDIDTGLRELAYNENTGVLYATDYTDLYTLNPTTGIATHIGSHGAGIENVWAMDYDPSIDKLVAVGHRPIDPCEPLRFAADMYYVNPDTGAATFIADTGNERLTDVWYDHTTDQMFALGNFPGKVMKMNTATGRTTDYRPMVPVEMNLLGAGNPSVPIAPVPMAMSATNSADGSASAWVSNWDTMEEDWQDDWDTDEQQDDPAHVDLSVSASITDAWQTAGSSSTTGFTVGSNDAHLQADLNFHTEGDDGGNPTIDRHGSGDVGASMMDGALVVGPGGLLPPGEDPPLTGDGNTATLFITIEEQVTEEGDGGWMDLFLWLAIYDESVGPPGVLFETDRPGTYEVEVPIGQTLVPELEVHGFGEGMDADLSYQVDVYFTAFGDVPIPEPASLSLLALGAAAVLIRRKRRNA